jgi:hypothetical protein
VPNIPRGALDKLDAWDQELLLNAARGRGGGEAQQNLRKLVESKGFTDTDASTQAKALKTLLVASPSSAPAGKRGVYSAQVSHHFSLRPAPQLGPRGHSLAPRARAQPVGLMGSS